LAKRRRSGEVSRHRDQQGLVPAIETRALRKVYPAPPQPKKRRGAASASPVGASFPGAPSMPPGSVSAGIVALEGLELDVPEGEFFGLLGPNGAGKTTTIGILTTRVIPTGGRASVAGADVERDAVRVRQRIGVVPQRPNP